MKSFKDWMQLKEVLTPATPASKPMSPMTKGPNTGAVMAKPGMPAKDPFLDKIRSIMKNNPQNAARQISTEYDNRIAKETKPSELARLSKEKTDTLNALK